MKLYGLYKIAVIDFLSETSIEISRSVGLERVCAVKIRRIKWIIKIKLSIFIDKLSTAFPCKVRVSTFSFINQASVQKPSISLSYQIYLGAP
jgi:hypothetical protein